MIFLRFDEAPILSSNICIIYEDEAKKNWKRDIYNYIINEAPTLDTKAMIFLRFDPFEYCKVRSFCSPSQLVV